MALTNATWDGQRIVTVVSRYSGLSNDTNSRSAVLDNVNLAMWEMSLHSTWDWNLTTASNIAVSATVSDYNLPTASGSEYDEIYDVRLVGDNERTLDFLNRSEYDKLVRGNQDTETIPTHYVLFGTQKGAVIQLVPTPSVTDVLRVRYYVQQFSTVDASATAASDAPASLAISNKYMPLIIYKAAELTAVWKRPELAPFWKLKYDEILARAINVDRVKQDENLGFIAQIEHGSMRLDFVNPSDAFYPR